VAKKLCPTIEYLFLATLEKIKESGSKSARIKAPGQEKARHNLFLLT